MSSKRKSGAFSEQLSRALAAGPRKPNIVEQSQSWGGVDIVETVPSQAEVAAAAGTLLTYLRSRPPGPPGPPGAPDSASDPALLSLLTNLRGDIPSPK